METSRSPLGEKDGLVGVIAFHPELFHCAVYILISLMLKHRLEPGISPSAVLCLVPYPDVCGRTRLLKALTDPYCPFVFA